nr:hypothetical protein [Tanacetum cinerariifolium]
MTSLFAESHNMVAILEKLDAAEGFEQIIDFLSGSYINHALTVKSPCLHLLYQAVLEHCCGKAFRCNFLPNEEIFSGLARMGYEKPSTKLTFYKAFFSTQWKFFIHTILHSLSAKRTSWNEFSSINIADLSKHTTRYISPALTQKVFANMRRVGKGFSGVETPLFLSMLAVRDVAEEAEAHVPAQGDDVQEPAAEEVATD